MAVQCIETGRQYSSVQEFATNELRGSRDMAMEVVGNDVWRAVKPYTKDACVVVLHQVSYTSEGYTHIPYVDGVHIEAVDCPLSVFECVEGTVPLNPASAKWRQRVKAYWQYREIRQQTVLRRCPEMRVALKGISHWRSFAYMRLDEIKPDLSNIPEWIESSFIPTIKSPDEGYVQIVLVDADKTAWKVMAIKENALERYEDAQKESLICSEAVYDRLREEFVEARRITITDTEMYI